MNYLNKPLKEYFTSELEKVLASFKEAEEAREKTSQHPKFDKANNKKAMEFPPPNPNYLKLKSAIEEELESRKK